MYSKINLKILDRIYENNKIKFFANKHESMQIFRYLNIQF